MLKIYRVNGLLSIIPKARLKADHISVSSSKKIMHYMEHKQLCLKCVFRTVFKPKGMDIYLIKDETRYYICYTTTNEEKTANEEKTTNEEK